MSYNTIIKRLGPKVLFKIKFSQTPIILSTILILALSYFGRRKVFNFKCAVLLISTLTHYVD